jgi:hypothetical protein
MFASVFSKKILSRMIAESMNSDVSKKFKARLSVKDDCLICRDRLNLKNEVVSKFTFTNQLYVLVTLHIRQQWLLEELSNLTDALSVTSRPYFTTTC